MRTIKVDRYATNDGHLCTGLTVTMEIAPLSRVGMLNNIPPLSLWARFVMKSDRFTTLFVRYAILLPPYISVAKLLCSSFMTHNCHVCAFAKGGHLGNIVVVLVHWGSIWILWNSNIVWNSSCKSLVFTTTTKSKYYVVTFPDTHVLGPTFHAINFGVNFSYKTNNLSRLSNTPLNSHVTSLN